MAVIAICLLTALSCRQTPHSNRVVVIQPLADFPAAQVTTLLRELKKTHPNIITRAAIPFPISSWYPPRNRYRADSLIKYLNRLGNADTVIIALTNKDISVTKDSIPDWGVMGYGYSPGNGCVVSSFRLTMSKQQDQFYKVAIHELGHTQGLPHCTVKNCFMRDAEGGNPLDEENDFCTACKSFLKSKGWQLK